MNCNINNIEISSWGKSVTIFINKNVATFIISKYCIITCYV